MFRPWPGTAVRFLAVLLVATILSIAGGTTASAAEGVRFGDAPLRLPAPLPPASPSPLSGGQRLRCDACATSLPATHRPGQPINDFNTLGYVGLGFMAAGALTIGLGASAHEPGVVIAGGAGMFVGLVALVLGFGGAWAIGML